MNVTTENLTLQVKETLLALPDILLMDTVLGWIECTDEMHQHLGYSDELRGIFGYQLQSGETEEIYCSFDALNRSESEAALALWVPPTIEDLRDLLTDFSLQNFQEYVIPLADDAISAVDPQKDPLWPSTALDDGQPFMRCLTAYLEQKANQEPEYVHLILPRKVARARNSVSTSYKNSPCSDLSLEMTDILELYDD
ncbi:MAG: hypothetical protein JO011_22700 [Ktedonobacteraceae bacterium]|nr:hypothetical protein [Ktedonobacteraceae bacterium]